MALASNVNNFFLADTIESVEINELSRLLSKLLIKEEKKSVSKKYIRSFFHEIFGGILSF